jgi:hypothetical protein
MEDDTLSRSQSWFQFWLFLLLEKQRIENISKAKDWQNHLRQNALPPGTALHCFLCCCQFYTSQGCASTLSRDRELSNLVTLSEPIKSQIFWAGFKLWMLVPTFFVGNYVPMINECIWSVIKLDPTFLDIIWSCAASAGTVIATVGIIESPIVSFPFCR